MFIKQIKNEKYRIIRQICTFFNGRGYNIQKKSKEEIIEPQKIKLYYTKKLDLKS